MRRLRSNEQAHAFLGDVRRRRRERERALSAHPIDQRRRALALQRLTEDSSIEHWARRDRHLYQWECDERSKALRSRNPTGECFSRIHRWAFAFEPERLSLTLVLRVEVRLLGSESRGGLGEHLDQRVEDLGHVAA